MSKISDDLFSFFSHFSQFLLFLSEHLSGCPPYPGCPGPFFTCYAFTLTFSTFTYAFFRKLRRWMLPGWMPGAIAFPAPPPLHATDTYPIIVFFFSNSPSFSS